MHRTAYMKTILISLVLIVMSGLAVFGQGVSSGPATTLKKAEEFSREKFDPTREPKADVEEAVTKAKPAGKRIILDIGGEWCGWCRYMDRFFYQNAELARIRDENFIWVKINYSEENENQPFLAAYPAITGYPHLFILDSNGTLLHSQPTDALEEGEGYNLAKFTEFLKTWSPKKGAPK